MLEEKWNFETHHAYKSLLELQSEWVIADDIFETMKNYTPQQHWTRFVSWIYQSIIYPVFWKYEVFNDITNSTERFDTLEEAQQYFN